MKIICVSFQKEIDALQLLERRSDAWKLELTLAEEMTDGKEKKTGVV